MTHSKGLGKQGVKTKMIKPHLKLYEIMQDDVESLKEQLFLKQSTILAQNERIKELKKELEEKDKEIQKSQSLTGSGSPIHKVQGTRSVHDLNEAEQTTILKKKLLGKVEKIIDAYFCIEEGDKEMKIRSTFHQANKLKEQIKKLG